MLPTYCIPKGDYCYSYTGKMLDIYGYYEDDKYVECTPYQVPEEKNCPYWSWDGFCSYLGEAAGSIYDQIKICDVNTYDEMDELLNQFFGEMENEQ